MKNRRIVRSSVLLAALMGAVSTAPPAFAHVVTYYTELSGAAESPVNDSQGIGTATVTLDLDLITMHVQASFSGLTGNTTNAHIHCCTVNPGTLTAGVATTTPTFTGFPSGVKSGTYDNLFDLTAASSYNPAFITANGGTVSGALNALVAGLDSGRAYFNIHSSSFGGGEIRGFLQVVPEPQTYALLLVGLGLMGWAAARRRRLG
jgi:hypothetical protein